MKKENEEKIKSVVDKFEDKEKLKVGAKAYINDPKKFQKAFKRLCRRCLAISIKCVKNNEPEKALSQYCKRCKKIIEEI